MRLLNTPMGMVKYLGLCASFFALTASSFGALQRDLAETARLGVPWYAGPRVVVWLCTLLVCGASLGIGTRRRLIFLAWNQALTIPVLLFSFATLLLMLAYQV